MINNDLLFIIVAIIGIVIEIGTPVILFLG